MSRIIRLERGVLSWLLGSVARPDDVVAYLDECLAPLIKPQVEYPMIREFTSDDMDAVLDIWLDASIIAHDFIDADFWQSQSQAMREVYIPASETYVYDDGQAVRGFLSLHGSALAALFVAPAWQGQGIGRELLERAQRLRNALTIEVYKENHQTIGFYERCGFAAVTEKVCAHTGHRELVMRCVSSH